MGRQTAALRFGFPSPHSSRIARPMVRHAVASSGSSQSYAPFMKLRHLNTKKKLAAIEYYIELPYQCAETVRDFDSLMSADDAAA